MVERSACDRSTWGNGDLTQGRTQGLHDPDQGSAILDIGNEPPLSVDGEVGELDHRRISVQWFSATILTGLCGAALMGGAVFAALDGEANFAASPELYEAGLRGTLSQAERGAPRKADRLPAPSESVAARQTIRVSTTARAGRPRGGPRAALYARRRQSVALAHRGRHHSSVQSAEAAGGTRSERGRERGIAGGGARRRGVLRHARSRERIAEGEARAVDPARRGRGARARSRRTGPGRARPNTPPPTSPAMCGLLMPPKAMSTPMRGSRRASFPRM